MVSLLMPLLVPPLRLSTPRTVLALNWCSLGMRLKRNLVSCLMLFEHAQSGVCTDYDATCGCSEHVFASTSRATSSTHGTGRFFCLGKDLCNFAHIAKSM